MSGEHPRITAAGNYAPRKGPIIGISRQIIAPVTHIILFIKRYLLRLSLFWLSGSVRCSAVVPPWVIPPSFDFPCPVSAQAPLAPARGGSGKEGGPAGRVLCGYRSVGWLRTYFRSSFRENSLSYEKSTWVPEGFLDLSYSMRRNELLPPFPAR